MPHAFLTETIIGKRHDLTELVKEYKDVTIGRLGKGAMIELGKDIVIKKEATPERTKEVGIAKLRALHALTAVSGKHATINYGFKGDYEGFFIKDHSRNGTWINGKKISGEKGKLKNRDVLRFGVGYYAVFECEESD